MACICYSGIEALQEIKEQKPELLFLDIEMPQMNGFELLQKIPNPDFKLIFTTSYDQYAIKAIRCSALGYLLKPIDRDELQGSSKQSNGAKSFSFNAATGNPAAKNTNSCFAY